MEKHLLWPPGPLHSSLKVKPLFSRCFAIISTLKKPSTCTTTWVMSTTRVIRPTPFYHETQIKNKREAGMITPTFTHKNLCELCGSPSTTRVDAPLTPYYQPYVPFLVLSWNDDTRLRIRVERMIGLLTQG